MPRTKTAEKEVGNTVRVADWTNDRKIKVMLDRVMLEVARTSDDCHTCPTCAGRATKIEEFLQGGSYVWKWVYADDGKWISIACLPENDPFQYLSDAVGLSINGFNPANSQPRDRSGTTQLSSKSRLAEGWVDSWQNSRRIFVESDRVLLQITLTCNHCSTCSARVRQMTETLERNPDVIYRWEYLPEFKDRQWISLPKHPKQDPFDVLRKALKIRLSNVRWS